MSPRTNRLCLLAAFAVGCLGCHGGLNLAYRSALSDPSGPCAPLRLDEAHARGGYAGAFTRLTLSSPRSGGEPRRVVLTHASLESERVRYSPPEVMESASSGSRPVPLGDTLSLGGAFRIDLTYRFAEVPPVGTESYWRSLRGMLRAEVPTLDLAWTEANATCHAEIELVPR